MGSEAAYVAIAGRQGEASHGILDMRLSELLWLTCFSLLLFASWLQAQVPALGYLDESVTLLLAVGAVAKVVTREGSLGALSREECMAARLLVMFVLVGMCGNVANRIQTSWWPIAIDVFACTKFFVVLLSATILMRDMRWAYECVVVEGKVLLLVMLPFLVANQTRELGMSFDVRYGIKSFGFIFGHPASLNAAVVGVFALLAVDVRRNGLWVTLCWLYLLSSLRSTGIAFAAASALLLATSGGKRRLRKAQIVLLGCISTYIGFGQLRYYFGMLRSARSELTRVSVLVANRFAPIGSGFAAFGSNVTAWPVYYSRLYYEYGLSGIQGLTLDQPSFLSDTFWPIVVGQFGWMGLAIFLLLCWLLARGTALRLSEAGVSALPATMVFLYLGLTSFSSSSFFHPMSVYLALCAALAGAELLRRTSDASGARPVKWSLPECVSCLSPTYEAAS